MSVDAALKALNAHVTDHAMDHKLWKRNMRFIFLAFGGKLLMTKWGKLLTTGKLLMTKKLKCVQVSLWKRLKLLTATLCRAFNWISVLQDHLKNKQLKQSWLGKLLSLFFFYFLFHIPFVAYTLPGLNNTN